MTDQAAPSNSPRTRSLLDLPTEVLAEIVRMCAEQDQAFKHRAASINRLYCQSQSVKPQLQRQETQGFGHSLNSVFKTSRTLSSLASPHLFRTLTVSRTVDDLSYRFYIASKYAHLFQHIIFDSLDPVGNSYLLASLHTFSSLNEISLTHEACRAIFGDNHHSSLFRNSPSDPPVTAFLHKAKSLRTLRLAELTPQEAVPFLKVCPNVCTLEIGSFANTPPDVEDQFARASSKIKSLILNLHDMATASLPSVSSPSLWPPLESLTIKIGSGEGNELDLDVIRRFQDSLVHLEVQEPAVGVCRYTPLTWTTQHSFPKLERITINYRRAATAFFHYTKQSIFPVLRHLRLSYIDAHDGDFGESDEVLLQVLAWSSLTHLDYIPPDHDFGVNDELWLRRKASERAIELVTSDCPPSTLPSSLRNALQKGVGYNVRGDFVDGIDSDVEADLFQTIGYARDYLDQVEKHARLTGDTIDLHRVVLSLRNLELDRVAKLD